MIPKQNLSGQPVIYVTEEKGNSVNLPERPYSDKVIPLELSLDMVFL